MKLRTILITLSLIVASVYSVAEERAEEAQQASEEQVDAQIDALEEPLFKPFIERYVLDELRAIRMEQNQLRAELAERVAAARVEANDRSIQYTSETMTIYFYFMAGATAVMALVGWNSLRDVRAQVEGLVNERVDRITNEYQARLADIERDVKNRSEQLSGITQDFEQRMEDVERRLKKRSQQIIAAQEEISKSNELHALWLRAGLETGQQSRIEIYDQILKVKPDDVEAITYKADLVLDQGECEWALNLSNMAIEYDENYAYAYWQRACAHAMLGNSAEAIKDIHKALEIQPVLSKNLTSEEAFASIRALDSFAQVTEGFSTGDQDE
jgi:tetratricopeptide (TPR) repeat protein